MLPYRHARSSSHGELIKHALEQVTSSSVEEIIISFVSVVMEDLRFFDPQIWRGCLAQPKFASLKRVSYKFSGPKIAGHEKEIEARVLQGHADWERPQIIEVVVVVSKD